MMSGMQHGQHGIEVSVETSQRSETPTSTSRSEADIESLAYRGWESAHDRAQFAKDIKVTQEVVENLVKSERETARSMQLSPITVSDVDGVEQAEKREQKFERGVSVLRDPSP